MARSKNFALNKRDDYAKQVVSVRGRVYARFEPARGKYLERVGRGGEGETLQ